MSIFLKLIIIIGILVFGFTYCVVIGYFLHCFNEVFRMLLKNDEQWKCRILRMKTERKKFQKKSEKDIGTERINGKSYISSKDS